MEGLGFRVERASQALNPKKVLHPRFDAIDAFLVHTWVRGGVGGSAHERDIEGHPIFHMGACNLPKPETPNSRLSSKPLNSKTPDRDARGVTWILCGGPKGSVLGSSYL